MTIEGHLGAKQTKSETEVEHTRIHWPFFVCRKKKAEKVKNISSSYLIYGFSCRLTTDLWRSDYRIFTENQNTASQQMGP